MGDPFAPSCPWCSVPFADGDPGGESHQCDPTPVLDPQELQRWLRLAYPAGGRDELLHVASPISWSGQAFHRRPGTEAAADIARHVADLDRRGATGVYLAACTLNPAAAGHIAGGGRGRNTDAAWLYGIWSDIDLAGPGHRHDPARYDGRDLPADEDAARAIVTKAGLPEPTCWVHSGGGLYGWWLLDTPAPAQEHAELVRDWQAALGRGAEALGWHYGTGVSDLARVMRLPGTVNRKLPDRPRQCRILSADGPRYAIESLVEFAEATKPAEKPPPAGSGAAGGPFTPPGGQRHHQDDDTPLNAYERVTDWAEILEPAGWRLDHTDGTTRYWIRPGKDTPGISMTTGHAGDRDRAWCFSDAAGLPVQTPMTKQFLYAHYNHGGDLSAAAQYLYDRGFGPRRNGAGPGGPPGPEAATEVLDDDFWTARPELDHIRTAAWARQRSGPAVLGVVLARLAAVIDHRLRIPAIVGSPAGLCLIATVLAPAGLGKSTANAIGAVLLPARGDLADQLPIGSGEGIAEVFFGEVDDQDDKGKPVKVRKQVRHNAFFFVDEGQVLTELANRRGATLLPTIRSAFTGGTLGQTNASESRRRVVPAGSYTLGMTVALQTEKAAPVLDDADGGTPQRLLWLPASDPAIPDTPPDWPGPLPWRAPSSYEIGQLEADSMSTWRTAYLPVAGPVKAEIRATDLARARGQAALDPLDAHEGLLRLKVAALLAILAGRLDVTEEDWQLAQVVKTASDTTRTAVQDTVKRNAARAEAQQSAKLARRAAHADAVVAQRRVIDCSRRIAEKVWAEPERWTRKTLRGPLQRWRDVLGDAIERAVTEGWVVEVTEPGQGGAKRAVRPGEVRPI